jgi:hypothetical protein
MREGFEGNREVSSNNDCSRSSKWKTIGRAVSCCTCSDRSAESLTAGALNVSIRASRGVGESCRELEPNSLSELVPSGSYVFSPVSLSFNPHGWLHADVKERLGGDSGTGSPAPRSCATCMPGARDSIAQGAPHSGQETWHAGLCAVP